MANDLKVVDFKTTMIKLQDRYLKMIGDQLETSRVPMDAYRNTCVLNAVSAIQNALDAKGASMNDPSMDQTSLTQCLLAVALFKLNASASPREVYFIVRGVKKTIDGKDTWGNKVEMGVEGDGNDAILRRFGADVKTVHPFWVVSEGDEWIPPRHVGISVTPPEWVPKGTGGVPFAVVYPISMIDGTVNYHISYRESVKSNLLAHISNNMQKETFGICADKYKASDKQKQEIDARKHELLAIANNSVIEAVLDNKDLWPWISPAWREPQSRELMIIRKMRNNIVKKIPKNFESDTAVMAFNDFIDEPETKDIGGDVVDYKPQPQIMDVNTEPTIAKISRPPRTHPLPQAEQPPEPQQDPILDIDDSDPEVFAQSDRMNGKQEQVGF